MQMTVSISLLAVVLFLLFVENGEGLRKNGVCSWHLKKYDSCSTYDFLCSNGECIDRALYCNGVIDCQDQSDEKYCRTYNCPSGTKHCPENLQCIPNKWFCDGLMDCVDGKDEASCASYGRMTEDDKCDELCVRMRALKWLRAQRKTESATETWGSLVDKFVVMHYLAADNSIGKVLRREMAYEVSLQFLSKLSYKKMADIPSSDLASYVNAFLVTCLDPRNFHGYDIVRELRSRVDSRNHTNPYAMLALCNAKDTITDADKFKLIEVFGAKRRTFWTDIQAVVVMALACASKQPGNDVDLEALSELALDLKKQQYRNGTVENTQTTALVLQALFSVEPDSDPDNFDEERALKQLLNAQLPDGSFGSFANTYNVLPVLSCTSLINVRSNHCDFIHRDDETSKTSVLMNAANRDGPKIRVRYSLWIGNDKDLQRNLALAVPANTSFYGVMELAAETDSRYRFEYVVKNRKPYINALSGLQDDPEKGKFWSLYSMVDLKPEMASASPADVTPKDNDHFAMWYRSESWID